MNRTTVTDSFRRRPAAPIRPAWRAVPAVVLLAASAAQAQIAVVAPAPAPVADGLWRGSGGAAATLTSGNTDGVAASLSLDAVRATRRDRITLGGSLNYGRSEVDGERETTADRWNASARYDYNLTPRTFVYGRASVESDRVVELDRRDTVDAGLGWKLIDLRDTSLSVFTGLGRSIDRYDREQRIDGRDDSRFARTTLTLAEESLHRLTPTVELRQRLDIAPTISGDRTTILRFSSSLAVALNSTLSLTVTLADQYNSEPPAGVRRNDLTLFTGINVKFGPQPPAAPPPAQPQPQP
ncbi:hypothetical protein CKO44_21445 [Rubrivivax gelatinosus]|nr:DUF481 domain-containing protein [Rubrivivax gelatinosus]MBK1616022.1 hypothetical protein [Rubrivivax gelatinosus]